MILLFATESTIKITNCPIIAYTIKANSKVKSTLSPATFIIGNIFLNGSMSVAEFANTHLAKDPDKFAENNTSIKRKRSKASIK